jgi:translocation and assembly module TamB
MLRRFFIAGFSILLAAILLVAAAGVFLLRTPAGQRFVLDQVLPRIAKETGVTIEIGSVGGAWPAEMRLGDVKLKDAGGTWFEAKSIAVRWEPALAWSGIYSIDSADIESGHLLREPNLPDTGPRPPGPRHYPPITLKTLKAIGFKIDEPVIDQALAFDLGGGLKLSRDGTVDSQLDVRLSSADLVDGTLAKIVGPIIQVTTRVSGTVGRHYDFGATRVVNADGAVVVAGSASYDIPTRNIAADLKAALAPKVVQEVDADVTTKSPVSVAVQTQGRWKTLQLTLRAQLGPSLYAGKDVPGANVDAKLSLANRHVTGPVRITFADAAKGQRASEVAANFSWDRKTAIDLTNIAADYRGTRATGDVAYDTKSGGGHASVAFDTQNLAALPLPVEARGALSGKANLDLAKGGAVDIALQSPALVIEGFALSSLTATAKGTFDSGRFQVDAKSASREAFGRADAVSVAGAFGDSKDGTQIKFDKLTTQIGHDSLRLAAPTTLTIGKDGVSVASTDLRWSDKGRIVASGSMGKEIVASLTIDGLELPQAPLIAAGQATIDTRKAETGRVSLKLTPIKGQGPELRSDIEGRWSGGRVALTGAIEGFGQDAAFSRIQPVEFSFPLVFDRAGKGSKFKTTGQIEGWVKYKGPIDRFLLLAPLAEQTLKGAADLDITASGTLLDPRFLGRASLQNGTYENVAQGILLDKLNAQGQVQHSGDLYVLSMDVSASDGQGAASPIKAHGVVQLGTKPRVEASLSLDHARIIHTQELTLVASGDLKLSGTIPSLAASGSVNVQSFEFQIPNALPPDIIDIKVVQVDAAGNPIVQETEKARSPPIEVALNVAIGGRQQIFIRGRGLDSEWSANMHVTGTESDPRLDGDLTLRRGSFDFAGRKFDLSQGTIHFSPSRSTDPDLSLQATSQTTSGTTAIINVSGRASRPDIKVTSDPAGLPADDVMALVLFGHPADQLTALQAIQVANAVATLSGSNPLSRGGPGILDRARTSLGLDLLDVSAGGQQGTGVTVGKYLRRGVFVSASPGIGTKASAVSATVDVSHSINVQTSVGEDSQESVGINWKYDY